jgi:hypothetical protein
VLAVCSLAATNDRPRTQRCRCALCNINFTMNEISRILFDVLPLKGTTVY